MYTPAHFALTDLESQHALLRQYPLGVLVTHTPDGALDANHLPFELDTTRGTHGVLTAHVARANPVWQQCQAGADGSAADGLGPEVLVVFRGAAGYISPNWYPSKHETHRQVPTWNYEAVHVHGRLTVVDDERFVRGVEARLTRTHEASEPQPWRMTDSAPEYIDQMLAMIVGIEITITRIEGKAKLSQNREVRDATGAVQHLQAKGSTALSDAMAAVLAKRGGQT